MISLGFVKEDPKLRPWCCRRTLFRIYSILPNDIRPLAYLFQRVVPDLQHPLYWDYPPACEHRHIVEYSEGPVD